MSVFLVTFDLCGPEKNYNCLYDRLAAFGAFAAPMQSTWLIKTPGTAQKTMEFFEQCLDVDDKMIVCEITDDYVYRGLDKEETRHFLRIMP